MKYCKSKNDVQTYKNGGTSSAVVIPDAVTSSVFDALQIFRSDMLCVFHREN